MRQLTDCDSVQCLQPGLHITLSYYQVPIYISSVYNEETEETEMNGVIPQCILPFILGSLNISYEFVLSDVFPHGIPKINGTWPGDLGLLQRKVADMCVGPRYLDYFNFVDFSPLESFQKNTITFLASFGKSEAFDFFSFLYHVDHTIWYMLFFAFALVVFVSSVSDSSLNGVFEYHMLVKALWKAFWILIASIFCEGSTRTMSTRRSQILHFLWLFVILVLVNVLYSQFKGILMVKTKDGFLKSIEELADKPNVLPLLLKDSIYVNSMKDSNLEALQRVYQNAISRKEECFIEGDRYLDIETYQLVKDGTHVLGTAVLFGKYMLKDICHILRGNRVLYFIPEELSNADVVFFANWDFPNFLRIAINQRLLWMKEGGFPDLWLSYHYRNFEKCEDTDKHDSNSFLQLKHLKTAFFFYLFLLSLSIAVYIIENIYFHLNKT